MSFFKRMIPLKADMAVNLQSITVENGQPFKGSAVLQSKEPFKVEEVRMEVRVVETWEEQAWQRDANGNMKQVMQRKEAELFSRNVPISQAFDMDQGGQKDFPFEILIPMRPPAHWGGSVSYSLKAVANVKGRPDVTKTANPMVVAATSPQVPAQGQVVIQKEVIKVPCKYCGNLVELTSGVNKCPSCGASIQIG